MEKFMMFYSKYRDYILCAIILIVMFGVQAVFFWYFYNDINTLRKDFDKRNIYSVKVDKGVSNKLIVDIKGEVKKPGVYYLDKGKRVIDVVNKAGGFTIDADSSANNLSKKIFDEMVIVIYSKDEIRDFVHTKENEAIVEERCTSDIVSNNSCYTVSKDSKTNDKITSSKNNSSSEKKLVSINDATLEELMTLSGIGESKAKAIIEYRSKKKFNTIEELKEVSGIGDSLFEKIKGNITV